MILPPCTLPLRNLLQHTQRNIRTFSGTFKRFIQQRLQRFPRVPQHNFQHLLLAQLIPQTISSQYQTNIARFRVIIENFYNGQGAYIRSSEDRDFCSKALVSCLLLRVVEFRVFEGHVAEGASGLESALHVTHLIPALAFINIFLLGKQGT